MIADFLLLICLCFLSCLAQNHRACFDAAISTDYCFPNKCKTVSFRVEPIHF